MSIESSQTNESDNQLIEQIIQGNKSAFQQLYERYKVRVFGFLYRFLGNAHAAEEVMQNTFVAVYRNIHRYRPSETAAPWIFKIAKNMARSRYRSDKRKGTAVSIDQTSHEDEKPMSEYLMSKDRRPDDLARDKQLNEEIQNVLNQLPEKYKTILIMHDVEGLSYEEIQAALGLPYKTLATQLTRARDRFKKLMKPERFGIQFFFRWLGLAI